MDLSKLGVWFFTDAKARPWLPNRKRIEDFGGFWRYGYLKPSAVIRSFMPLGARKYVLSHRCNGYRQYLSPRAWGDFSSAKNPAEQSDNRFLLGLGVSHKPLVEGLRG
ncbi:MAG: hypothetical protein Ct9H300mP8_01740 [Gammaproteobacteria bacterium]|nr:MAG: hypothetical protein Ct9H300mP8_01740 [Gammaproteobacteria bacterium]